MGNRKSDAEKIKMLEIKLREQDFINRQLSKRLDACGEILGNMQPILARLIGVAVILESKGIYHEQEVTDSLTKAASEKLAEKVRGGPQGGAVVSNFRDGNGGIPGTPSTGGTEQGDSVIENGERPCSTRLPDVRSAPHSSNGVDNISKIEEKDVLAK